MKILKAIKRPGAEILKTDLLGVPGGDIGAVEDRDDSNFGIKFGTGTYWDNR